MDHDLFATERLDEHRMLCISSLARKTIVDAEADHLGIDSGFFVYEVDERPNVGGIQVLAKVASIDAAYRLIEILAGRASSPQAA